MVSRPKYYFNVEKKNEFLQGRNIKYVATKSNISYSYLIGILRGIYSIDGYLVDNIMNSIGYSEKEKRAQYSKYFQMKDED